jgi:hypothetical protein
MKINSNNLLLLLCFSLFGCLNLKKMIVPSSVQNVYAVHYFLLEECRICIDMTPSLNMLYSKYSNDSIQFMGHFVNIQVDSIALAQWALKYKVKFELQNDIGNFEARRLGASVAPQVVVESLLDNQVLYSGRINSMYSALGKRSQHISEHNLEDVLSAIVANRNIQEKETQAIGCFINFVD